ncbi:aminoglycoside phosphotransferase family protein [Brevibacterium zhoupengii]|uniref:aminoglycoside phosphotransferase family protein n=1 Tax=Brevibacterium zhoupengii TaxID=2898795 RepID=UPI001E4DBB87|nr:aminoglycoside phosphotransferase family protein [Brevibacterium zhoupengii]
MDERAIALLRARGWKPGEILGSGMEGTVVDLSADEVAKVWHERRPADLEPLLRFGSALEQSPIPFRCSRTIESLSEDSLTITIEQKDTGRPLRLDAMTNAPVVTDEEIRLMSEALAGLSQADAGDLSALPILPGEEPFLCTKSFGGSLADLAGRRFTARPELLRQAIGDIDKIFETLLRRLRDLPDPESKCLIHGDLIPANVLIEDGEVAGVVDFGFLTTVGDPQFDAAIAASSFDMYGPNARRSENALSKAFSTRFGHDLSAYGLYRAAYAVITNSYFATDSQDGHFRWCAQMLRREDVRDAIANPSN